MAINLDRINPKFRQLVDLLLFSDRMDLDLSNFKSLLRESNRHSEYLWDRFERASDIFWEDGATFWFHRLSFLFSLNDKSLSKHIEEFLENRMFEMMRNSPSIDVNYNIEFMQYVECCKVKYARKDSLLNVRAYLIDYSSQIAIDKLIVLVEAFIPFIFKDLNEYADCIMRGVARAARSFDLLLALEARGLKFDRHPIAMLARDILISRAHNDKNRRAFFTIINDPEIMGIFKRGYDTFCRDKLLQMLEGCDYTLIEDQHLRNFKNLMSLDSTLGDEVAVIYADKLFLRGTGHKKANADRLIRLLKNIPQVAPKKILAYLSANNRMSDIKYILASFPELKKLAAFV